MNAEKLEEAVALAAAVGAVFVATADRAGVPHVACAGKIELDQDRRVIVTEWFCPGTVANVCENEAISIVAWDATTDTGYQLIGRLQGIENVAVLNGYGPGLASGASMPQVERRLTIEIERVLGFCRRPHSDLED